MKASNEMSPNERVDEDLFQSFQEITNSLREFYAYLTLSSSKKSEVAALWPEGKSPSLRAELRDTDIEYLSGALTQLDAMKQTIPADNNPIHVLYRWKLDETEAQITMILASNNNDMELFHQKNHDIYGAPDEVLYRSALDWVCNDAEAILQNPESTPVQQSAARVVVNRLSSERGYRELLSPESEVFQDIRQQHFKKGGYYALLLDGITQPSDTITEENGDEILEHVLRNNIGSDYSYEKKPNASWGISHNSRRVQGPERYKYSWNRFIGLPLGHEVGTHLLETKNALNGPLMLASVGLDRYEKGSEGRAVVREQVPYDNFDEFGKLVRWRDILRRHIAISFAEGVGENVKPAHHEVYDFMYDIDYMYAQSSIDSTEDAQDKAKSQTQKLLMRVLKGADKEGAYLKDKVYLEGNVAAWLAAAMRGASAISEADKAKYDINNSRHLLQLIKLGVINQNA